MRFRSSNPSLEVRLQHEQRDIDCFSAVTTMRPPLRPSKSDRKGWWESFWKSDPDRFGDPSHNVLGKLELYMERSQHATAIDVGSGNGRYALAFNRLGLMTTAIEWTRTGSEIIQARARRQNATISVLNQDFLSYATPNKYDVVFSSGLLEELTPTEQPHAISNLASLAKDGSIILIKFCVEIDGRGALVDSSLVQDRLRCSGISILFAHIDRAIKHSRSDMFIMTSTIVGRKTSSINN